MRRGSNRIGSVQARRQSGSIAVVVLITVAIMFVIAAAGAWWVLYKPTSSVAPGQSLQVEIPSGASTSSIATQLADKGVVANPTMFRIKTRQAQADGQLRAGVYDLATGMPYDLVIEKLIEGPPIAYVTVTIPEGWVIEQIAERLAAQAGIDEQEFLDLAKGGAEQFANDHPYLKDAYKGSLEGYLFPKTYRLREGTTAAEAIEIMLDQFDTEIAGVDVAKAEKRGFDLSEVVIMASMIEREARIPKERPLVSSVIHNRLEIGRKLEICATVEYVLPGNRLRLTYKQTRTPTPYNTYLHKGLPPGPISNPGLASLQAAVDPADTDYIYYVLTGKDGSQTYAATEAEFLKAKRKSKEVFGQ